MKKILDKKEWIIIGVLIMLLISVPFIIGGAVKVHEGDKPISIDNWLIYYATIGGALIGGFITSVGLYITIKQTRDIQQENKLREEKSERKEFINEIETLVGQYIADIGVYFYAQVLADNKNVPPADRSKSIAYYRILNIKLSGIDEAKPLLTLLKDIHNKLCFFEKNNEVSKKEKILEEKFEELSQITKRFGKEYIG
ncbi:hypothetical protein QYB28_000563 [Clostridium perfringens]|uniref:hypothetical protein n=1 Tax=Clostridium perfringens TaxID=1502 RepID=UPI000F54127F|nr:hypothetical protein [Clostridium perfringens]MDK3222628.1 hypothetical protein [Clostridium perfringens]MDV5090086.1 hypothetical protein [Clostridium perfringens]MDV5108136.1 hypothetical protein [Clostridium perfringens]MDZ5014793.1 hypothetical protein [Clostridium perfringens]RQN17380.1 hypothetical protein EHZ12_06620 [Clostridium perfringens]